MKNRNNKILITGGVGFIGANLVEYLLEKTDWQINILDNLSQASFANLKSIKNYSQPRIFFFKGDIRNKKDAVKAIKDCKLVVNLAAQTGIVPSQKDPLKDAQINILGTLNLLEVARKHNVERFIQASSAAPLGNQEMPLDEKKLPRPLSPYGASKLAGEAYCSAYAASFGLNTVVLRISNAYGPYSAHKQSVVPKFIKQILQQKPVTIYGQGDQTRDFIYVQDICQAIYLALTKDLPSHFELFQLGTGKQTSVNDLFTIIKKEFENKGQEVKKPIHKPQRKGEMKRNYSNISKAKRILGFQPQKELPVGIAQTINWFL